VTLECENERKIEKGLMEGGRERESSFMGYCWYGCVSVNLVMIS
jgi:hypothetical protein